MTYLPFLTSALVRPGSDMMALMSSLCDIQRILPCACTLVSLHKTLSRSISYRENLTRLHAASGKWALLISTTSSLSGG